ncbi:MAG TPA: response regulator [Candidatus Sulfotelmatobacter sp.]
MTLYFRPKIGHDLRADEPNALPIPVKRILCVDDDLSTLKLRKALFEAAGYSVLTADSGRKALELLTEVPFVDLVVMDYLMPGMNGDELAKNLKERFPQLPLIAVSGVDPLPNELLNLVNGHVSKGQREEALLSTVQDVLRNTTAFERNEEQSFTQHTVLCVEDEQLQLQLRKMLLESAGFRVLQAQTAAAALELFHAQRVDAVVMDYWLSGGKNGTAVAEEMKRLRPNTPIVMLSGFSSLPGEGAVVDAWLRKAAIEPEDLIHEVRRLITLRTETSPRSLPK